MQPARPIPLPSAALVLLIALAACGGSSASLPPEGPPPVVAGVVHDGLTAAERGRTMLATDWIAATERQQVWALSVIDWMSAYDVVVTPTAGTPPMRTDELWPPAEKPWKISAAYARIGLFTLPFNVTGQPAISVPTHWTDDGLPVGVQLAANMGHDPLLLDLATRLEEALPWPTQAVWPGVS